MTREQAIEQLIEQQANDDPEVNHYKADVIICELLRSLGYDDVVDEWEAIERWYA